MNSLSGRILNSLKRGKACSYLFLDKMALTAFLFDSSKHFKLERGALL